MVDEIDFKAIDQLMQNGRMTWAELGGILGLSAPAAADRVRQLENHGVITGYTALVDPEAVGYGLSAFIAVTLDRPQHRAAFLELVERLPEVQECHHVAGDDDYWLKVRCSGTRHLDWLLSEQLKGLPGVLRTRTTIVLSTTKETLTVPLPTSSAFEG
ncbi:MAG: Lrp/AsnC family transcriptional regulator [Chloroflexota bacterium]